MRKFFFFFAVTFLLSLALPGISSQAFGQNRAVPVMLASSSPLPDAPLPQSAGSSSSQSTQDPSVRKDQSTPETAPDLNRKSPQTPAGVPATQKPKPLPEPKRILGMMPNYRAVSAGVLPPPPSSKQAFIIASQNSFDYSSFVFVGITSLMAEGTESHPSLGKGVGGFWGYTWRGFVDKTDGNYWVIWLLPSIVHQDERYYAKGQGPIKSRVWYAATRIFITPNYKGKNVFNSAEIFGRGISQSISLTYYPAADQSVGPFMEKFGYALGRDALTNVFREVWPDVDAHVLHRHRRLQQ